MKLLTAPTAVLLFILCSTAISVAQEADNREAFCGFIAAKACVEELGVRWQDTPNANMLESLPIANFGEIILALESFGLFTHELILDSRNALAISHMFLDKHNPVAAIGWVGGSRTRTAKEGQVVGHFLTVTNVNEQGIVSTFDGIAES